MKFLLLIVLSGCSVLSSLKTKNLESVEIGADEKELLKSYYVYKVIEINQYKFIPLYDGILVSKDSKVIDKFPLSHPYEFSTTVSTYTKAPGEKFTYFIEANPRSVDPRSIFFANVKGMVTKLLQTKGQKVTEDRKSANAVLSVGYGIGSSLTKSWSNDPLNLMTKVTYNRFLQLSAYKTEQPDINIWESKVESPGKENDPSIYIPGLLAAVGDINGKSEEAVQTSVDSTDVLMNLYANSAPFEKYLQKP